MGKAADLSPAKIREVSTLLNLGTYTQRKIAALANISQSTVRNISKKLNENESLSPNRVGKCGRKRITTPRTERKIQQITLQNRRKPEHTIRKLLEDSGIALSRMTLRRRWMEMGFCCRRPVKKPKLTPVMMKKRLAFARKYANWTEKDWEKVIFLFYPHNFFKYDPWVNPTGMLQ